jgi:hypothetical protein
MSQYCAPNNFGHHHPSPPELTASLLRIDGCLANLSLLLLLPNV